MKRMITLITIIALGIGAKAQTYHPFLNNTNWYMAGASQMGPFNFWYVSLNDTSINNKTYKKIWNSQNYFYVREDTINKTVFNLDTSTNTEYLLYNFSLSIGQSYITKIFGVQITLVLQQIGTENTNNGIRNKYSYSSSNGYNVTAIEGVGSILDPLLISTAGSEWIQNLVCSYENHVQVYMNNLGLVCSPDTSVSNSIITPLLEKIIFRLSPNPASTNITLETPQQSTIQILTLQGQLIKTINATQPTTTLDISSLARGMYFLKVMNEKGSVVRKFVKE